MGAQLAVFLESGHGGMTVTAMTSLKSSVLVTNIDQGNALVWILAGWLKVFCSLFLTSGMRARIQMELLNCLSGTTCSFVSKNDE